MMAAAAGGFATGLISLVTDEPYFLDPARPVRIGVSIGFACAPADADMVEALHHNADAALYDAKGAGRGIHRRFSGLPSHYRPKPVEQMTDNTNGLPL